jgi:hypothetical protein
VMDWRHARMWLPSRCVHWIANSTVGSQLAVFEVEDAQRIELHGNVEEGSLSAEQLANLVVGLVRTELGWLETRMRLAQWA